MIWRLKQCSQNLPGLFFFSLEKKIYVLLSISLILGSKHLHLASVFKQTNKQNKNERNRPVIISQYPFYNYPQLKLQVPSRPQEGQNVAELGLDTK